MKLTPNPKNRNKWKLWNERKKNDDNEKKNEKHDPNAISYGTTLIENRMDIAKGEATALYSVHTHSFFFALIFNRQ